MKPKVFLYKSCFFILTSLILSNSFFPLFNYKKPNIVSAETITPTNNLLQFTSNNHAVAFKTDSIFIASPTHMMKIGFVNSNNTTPISESTSTTTLDKVTYNNIWNAIDAIYESQDGSLMKSTYIVDKNISPDNIKFRHNTQKHRPILAKVPCT